MFVLSFCPSVVSFGCSSRTACLSRLLLKWESVVVGSCACSLPDEFAVETIGRDRQRDVSLRQGVYTPEEIFLTRETLPVCELWLRRRRIARLNVVFFGVEKPRRHKTTAVGHVVI